MTKKNALLAWTAISLIAGAAPAWAQSEEPGASQNPEIVVTAQKREENLLEVPVSISVVSGEDSVEQGASSLTDYAGYVPGMQVSNSGTPGQATVTLRGVAQLSGGATVGTYLDDAPVGSSSFYNRAGGFTLDLLPYDIERVEVLRGPQGTLYGASTIGGLLKYVTVAPSTSELSARAGGEIFDIKGAGGMGWAARAMVNVPLVTDQLGVTGSFSYRKTPGYVNSVNNAALTDQNAYDQMGGRVSLLWTPTPQLDIRLTALWQSIDAEGNGLYAASLAGARLGDGHSFNNYVPEPFTTDLSYYAATVGYDFGGATLTSTTTYSQQDTVQVQDGSYAFGVLFPLLTGGAIGPGITPFTITLGLDKWTQEVRLASSDSGAFEWLIGGFYTDEDSTNTQLVRSFDMTLTPIAPLDPLATVALPATYKEYAVFANAGYSFSEMFELGGGVRWARNKQTFRQISSGAIVPTANDPGESSEDVFTFSLSPQFHLDRNAMLYARVATGYRPGGPNVIVLNVPPSVGADRVTNYELGFKGELGEGAVVLDIAAFRIDWKDIQVARAFGGVSGLANGGKARSQGIEGSLLVNAAPGFTIAVAASFTDAQLSEDVPEISGADGDRLPGVPKFSGSVRADYHADFGGSLTGDFGIGVRRASNRLSLVESDPLVATARPYTSVDLNAGITIDERWTIRTYVRNLLDNEGELGRSTYADGLNRPSFLGITPLQPRTAGVAVDVAF